MKWRLNLLLIVGTRAPSPEPCAIKYVNTIQSAHCGFWVCGFENIVLALNMYRFFFLIICLLYNIRAVSVAFTLYRE